MILSIISHIQIIVWKYHIRLHNIIFSIIDARTRTSIHTTINTIIQQIILRLYAKDKIM